MDILGKQITAAVSSRVSSHIMTKSQRSIPLMIALPLPLPFSGPYIRSASSSMLLLSSGVGDIDSYPFWYDGNCFGSAA